MIPSGSSYTGSPSPSPRRAWIEILLQITCCTMPQSPSPRRAWIEIQLDSCRQRQAEVALPTEGVDRNNGQPFGGFNAGVALPTEGVDRNSIYPPGSPALTSPSPRRAWIEIQTRHHPHAWTDVALPTEGVDRNSSSAYWFSIAMSPSPRRAWIEMGCDRGILRQENHVALPTEGVDRNHTGRNTAPLSRMSPSPRRAWIEITRTA